MREKARLSAIAAVLVGMAALALASAEAQSPPSRPAAELQPGPIPRLANGKPNLQGTWFRKPAPRPPGAPAGGGGGFFGEGGPPRDPNVFMTNGARIPYTPEATRERKWLNTQEALDGEPNCQLPGTPRAALSPPYPHVIIQDDKQVVILYEAMHEARVIPLDGKPRLGTRTWSGESRGHWDGDTLVVETTGFNGRNYIAYNEIMSAEAKVVERFTVTGPNLYNYEVTITDPVMYTGPMVIKTDVARQPAEDMLLSYDCLEGEDSLKHYSVDVGGMGGAKLVKQPASIYGCLRAEPDGKGDFTYTVKPYRGTPVKLTPLATLKKELPVMMDREVKFDGKWISKDKDFSATYADVHATGCRWEGN